MELVYLWVEEYKNIHKQGFNFSPNFNCTYDPENKELTIKDNPNYIENFFGENINVTAIVGKNGSGKSNLLELINHDGYENPISSPFPISSLDFTEIRLYYDRDTKVFYKYQNNLDIFFLSISPIGKIENINTDTFGSIAQLYSIFIKSNPYHGQREYIRLLNFLINNNVTFPFSIPEFINMALHDDYFDLLEGIKSDAFDFSDIYFPFGGNRTKRVKLFHVLLLVAYLNNYDIRFSIEASESYDATIRELESYIESDYQIGDKTILDQIRSFIDTLDNYLENFFKQRKKIDTFDDFDNHIYLNKLPKDFFDIYMKIVKDFIDGTIKEVFIFDFFPPLSDGEYQSVYLYSQIYSEKIKHENIQLLIDEGENFLHPNWQKKYLGNLIKFLRNNYTDKKIHLMVTSHSPFLLSDIPKQNIIFLDTYKENDNEVKSKKQKIGNCKVVKGDDAIKMKQTFGANIHTLLSDSFFMDDGLMGEFAKGKINEIIEFHNIVFKDRHKECLKKIYEKRKKRFWQTQSIIGEEYLKQIIKNHLVEIEKILLGKDEAKRQEIERTKAYLERLEND